MSAIASLQRLYFSFTSLSSEDSIVPLKTIKADRYQRQKMKQQNKSSLILGLQMAIEDDDDDCHEINLRCSKTNEVNDREEEPAA